MDNKDNILFTFKYFDLFDYSLRLEDIWRWLFDLKNRDRLSRQQMEVKLGELIVDKLIDKKEGYYFLPGREEIVEVRKEREEWSLLKIKKAQWIARLLRLIPGVKLIAICSNLGYLNADSEADIDLFVVAAKDRIWLVRFWMVVLMKFLGQRPTKNKARDKICLSYFITEDNLNLEQTKVGDLDVHLIYLLAQYLPIYSEDKMWEKFVAENGWVNKYLPNFIYGENDLKYMIKPRFGCIKNLFNQTVLPAEEKLYQWIQMKILPAVLKEMMNRGDNKVIINDKMLKLHSNDKREEINKILNYKFSRKD